MNEIQDKSLKVSKVVYYNKESKWGVLGCDPKNGLDGFEDLINDFGSVTVSGNFEGVYEGAEIILSGDVVTHPKFGKQVCVKHIQVVKDTKTKEGIVNFLSKSNIGGISTKNAVKIYDYFGSSAIDIILNYPERIKEIKGISSKTYMKVLKSVQNYKESKELIDFCTNLGMGYHAIMKIKDAFGKKAINILKENPYKIIGTVKGISFKQIDDIFISNGGGYTDYRRLSSALLKAVEDTVTLEGSTGCSYNKAYSKYKSLLFFPQGVCDLFDETLNSLSLEGKIMKEFDGSKIIFYKEYTDIEKKIATSLKLLGSGEVTARLDEKLRKSKKIVDEEIHNFPFSLNDQQIKAVINCLKHKVSVLTGAAGCLTGSALISYSINGICGEATLKDLYDMYEKRVADMEIEVMSFIENEGVIKLNPVKNVVYSGKKEVYELVLENGKSVEATATHRILTSNGYKEFKDLTTNDYVMIYADERVPSYSRVVKITYKGSKDTYDICCYENHNFVANDIVVHNSGKSSITKALYNIYTRVGYNVYLLAPTAKACRRLEECIPNSEASTIHKFLSRGNSELPENSVIIIDEASMVDIILLNNLLSIANADTRILFVGDNNQLPSVQAGNVLGDLIDSKAVHVSLLTDVTRQKEDSHIIEYCNMINEGNIIHPCNFQDFHYEEFGTSSELKDFLFGKYIEEIIENGLSEVQVIAPYKKGEVGAVALNTLLQNAYQNEYLGGFCIDPYRIGDRVRHTVNNYDKDVYNGEVGIITSYDENDEVITVDYGSKTIDYTEDELEELTLNYASTIHSSQGSEYKVVFVILDDTAINDFLLIRRLLYTAVSRGKEKVYILTKPYLVDKCILNSTYKPRVTKLRDFLCESF